ncbi:MAG: N-methyl-L-tryptophan oxidase [Proteobacteria bacterium]|nr:N-methyl-L-tryptophan oxidase [Pseudomonadota bacterium]
MNRVDVIVVGVGALGSAATQHLAEGGLSVIGIDRFHPPHRRGSSYGGTRLIRKAYFEDPRYVPLLERSYELWDQLAKKSGEHLFHRTGLLVMSSESAGVGSKILNTANQHHVKLEVLAAGEVRERFPQFAFGDEYYGIFEPDAGYLEVETSLKAQLDAAKQAGARFRFGETVTSWSASGSGIVVTTDHTSYEAKSLVLAPGAWSAPLISDLGMTLKVTRAPVFWFRSRRDCLRETNGMPCFAVAERGNFVYGFPDIGEVGVKLASYAPSMEIPNPDLRDQTYTEGEIALISQCVANHLPALDPKPSSWNVCMYTSTVDENFIVGPHPSHPNVFLATGESGHAFKFAPVIGEIMTKFVTKQPLGFDVDFLAWR